MKNAVKKEDQTADFGLYWILAETVAEDLPTTQM